MKKFFKTVSLVLAMIFTVSFASFSSYAAIDVDGVVSTKEWDTCVKSIVYTSVSQSANNISLAEIKTIKTDDNTIFLAVTAVDAIDEYLDDCGIKITVPGIGVYTFGVDNTTDFANNDNLNIQFGTTASTEGAFFFEFKFTFKKPVLNTQQFKMQLRDGAGILSKESVVNVVPGVTTSINPTTTTTKKYTATSNKNTTKFTTSGNNNSTTESKESTSEETTTEFIAKIDNNKSSNTKIQKTVLSVLAIFLVLLACYVLLIARPRAKKQEESEEKSDKK